MLFPWVVKLLHVAAVRQHGINLRRSSALGRKDDVHAVRRPPRIFIASGAVGQLI